jgi:hypothetical protein
LLQIIRVSEHHLIPFAVQLPYHSQWESAALAELPITIVTEGLPIVLLSNYLPCASQGDRSLQQLCGENTVAIRQYARYRGHAKHDKKCGCLGTDPRRTLLFPFL